MAKDSISTLVLSRYHTYSCIAHVTILLADLKAHWVRPEADIVTGLEEEGDELVEWR